MKSVMTILGGLALALAVGCASVADPSQDRTQGGGPPLLTVSQLQATLDSTDQALTATVSNGAGFHVTWSATGGTVKANGAAWTYTSPEKAGTYTVTASLAEYPSVSASVPVEVRKIAVSADPKTATILPGDYLHVSATLAGGFPDNTGNPSVTWSTSGGTVDASNIYHAPTATGLYVVRATSSQDARKYDEAIIQVGGDVACYVTPKDVRLVVGQTQQFQALVFGTDNKAVYWSANGGTIDQNGLFKATDAGTWSVTVMSAADPSKVAQASVNVVAAK